ncbi:MAG: hypothetical protein A2X77_00160 [Gammaproteobacteria bacterium GWE2_42_36]|nr:MAG: hypothetical protein A2X77_00160 [Gammaproteobacteria bacterium GWE2_42_36]HCU05196.1 hypothetical protein [Coxiellaceae bacterium]
MAAKKKIVMKKKPVVSPKKAQLKLGAAKKIITKSEMQKMIAEYACVSKKQVDQVFEALTEIVRSHVTKGAVGLIKLDGLLKIERLNKPAKKARKGINPFTGEEMMFKAKPAHSVIKIRALKKLKAMV